MFRFRDEFAGFTVHLSGRVTSRTKRIVGGQQKEWRECMYEWQATQLYSRSTSCYIMLTWQSLKKYYKTRNGQNPACVSTCIKKKHSIQSLSWVQIVAVCVIQQKSAKLYTDENTKWTLIQKRSLIQQRKGKKPFTIIFFFLFYKRVPELPHIEILYVWIIIQ